MDFALSPSSVDNDAFSQSTTLVSSPNALVPYPTQTWSRNTINTTSPWQDKLADRQPNTGYHENSPAKPLIIPTCAADWDAVKDTIRGLYIEENKILKEVIEIMVTRHRFKATARMYKGQFAKWQWSKYKKAGKTSAVRPAISRAPKTRASSTNRSSRSTEPDSRRHPSLPQGHLRFANTDELEMEVALAAYDTLIRHWCEYDTPWRMSSNPSQLGMMFNPELSILQRIRMAGDYFRRGQPAAAGETLRRAFLRVEHAVQFGGASNIEAIWDCCLGVPQLALTTGWVDILAIFTRYLHQYSVIKLSASHPITKVAAFLNSLSSVWGQQPQILPANGSLSGPTPAAHPHHHHHHRQRLEYFISRAWSIWMATSELQRGRADHVTVHLKRGYVTVVDPTHPSALRVLDDFREASHASVSLHGAAPTTSRTLELEALLVHMYVPLFSAEAARRTEATLTAVVERVMSKEANRGKPPHRWDYVDRYLVFSANHFMAALAEGMGQEDKAEWYRWRSLYYTGKDLEPGKDLNSGKDLFWAQTSLLLEARLRARGLDDEAERIRMERSQIPWALE